MGRAEDNWTFTTDLHLPDSVELVLVNNNFFVDALE